MGDIWSLSLLLLALAVLVVGFRLATGNRLWANDPVTLNSPPNVREGILVSDRGDISPGVREEEQSDQPSSGG